MRCLHLKDPPNWNRRQGLSRPLSDTQLERKRANDREAQRIIRKCRRERIENLERQVAEVSRQKQQRDKALQHNSGLETQIGVLQPQVAEITVQLQYGQGLGVQKCADTVLPYGIDTRLRHPFYRRQC